MKDLLPFFLQSQCGPDFARSRYLLAVSGGLDSTVLLDAFATSLPADRLIVAHYQHGVRGLAAEGDALFVETQAASRGIAFQLGRRDPGRPNDEASLRADRRRFLENARAQAGCDWIVTAHHADDQLETLLMRLLRGTGITGLGAIAPRQGAWLRPWLQLSKQTLVDYAQAHCLEFREDATNATPAYFRNRVRAQLLPAFYALAEEHGGPEAFLQRTGALCAEARETETALDVQTRSLFAHAARLTPFWQRWNKPVWERLDLFWRHRLLRKGLALAGVPALDRLDLERLARTIGGQIPSASFPGVRFVQSCGYFYLQTPEQAELLRRPRRVEREGSRVWLPDLEMELELPSPEMDVRFFEPGDRLGGRKLKEVFLMHRIPQPERRLIPLLANPGSHEVSWIYPQTPSGVRVLRAEFSYAASIQNLANQIGP